MRALWVLLGWAIGLPACMVCSEVASSLGAGASSAVFSLLGPLLVGVLAGWKIRSPRYAILAFLFTSIPITCVLGFFNALALMSTSGYPWYINCYFLIYPCTVIAAATTGSLARYSFRPVPAGNAMPR